jgi:hypothetical protein
MNHHDQFEDRDEREWLAQERARLEARNPGATPSGDPMVARYRKLSHALRTPMTDALPDDFAANVARLAQAGVVVDAPLDAPDATLERKLTNLFVGLFAIAAVVVAAMYGSQWLPPILGLLHLDSSVAVNWALALAACVGATWATEHLRRHKESTHAA